MARLWLARTGRFLSHHWWQGVAAVVAIVALAAYFLWPSPPDASRDDRSTGTRRVTVSGNGSNCVIQGGSGNTCTQADGQTAAATPSAGALKVHWSWPTIPECDGATEVAIPPGGAEPSSIVVDRDSDLRDTLTRDGAAAYGLGHLAIDLSTSGPSAVQITGLKPLIYKSRPLRPAWVFDPQGGCGDTYTRRFEVNLDRRTIIDAGVAAEADPAQATPRLRREPLGRTFHVTNTDPAHLEVDAVACRAWYDWGLRVDYLVDGQPFSYVIGSRDTPLNSVGTADSRIPSYTSTGTRLAPVGSAYVVSDCR